MSWTVHNGAIGSGGGVFIARLGMETGETSYEDVYTAVTSGKLVLIEDYSLRDYVVGGQVDRMCPFDTKIYPFGLIKFKCVSPLADNEEEIGFYQEVLIYEVTP